MLGLFSTRPRDPTSEPGKALVCSLCLPAPQRLLLGIPKTQRGLCERERFHVTKYFAWDGDFCSHKLFMVLIPHKLRLIIAIHNQTESYVKGNNGRKTPAKWYFLKVLLGYTVLYPLNFLCTALRYVYKIRFFLTILKPLSASFPTFCIWSWRRCGFRESNYDVLVPYGYPTGIRLVQQIICLNLNPCFA